MRNVSGKITVWLVLCVLSVVSAEAEEVSKAQIKGLDEQVQDIKGDVLSIAAELNQLEEKLLYPAHSQVSLFLSLAEKEGFRLDSVEIELDGQAVAHHLYSFKELEALRKGGVQRIFTGNLKTGPHEMEVTLKGQTAGGADVIETETYEFHKDVGPGFVELVLARNEIAFKER